MFRDTIDYHILKPLTHSRLLATEAELANSSGFTLDDARAYADKARNLYFDKRLPIDSNLSYLDVGCGPGKLSIGLSLAGVKDITGIDTSSRSIAAAKAVAQQLPADGRPDFLNMSSHAFKTKRQYDVVIALAVMEHTDSPDLFLRGIYSLLKTAGHAYVSMTPFPRPLWRSYECLFQGSCSLARTVVFRESRSAPQGRTLPPR